MRPSEQDIIEVSDVFIDRASASELYELALRLKLRINEKVTLEQLKQSIKQAEVKT